MEQTLTESEKIEQLMRPRYKVIATYPFNDHFMLNEVIELNEFDGREHLSATMKEWYTIQRPLNPNSDKLPLTMHESTFNLYPHLFKRLEWYEERDESDMPQYVKNDREVVKVEYHFSMYSLNLSDEPLGVHTHFTYADKKSSNYIFWSPATEADYLAYTQPSPINQEK